MSSPADLTTKTGCVFEWGAAIEETQLTRCYYKYPNLPEISEDSVGSYSLQDFFTHKLMICGFTPEKTLRLAKLAYAGEFSDEELTRWITSYCKRYFSQQFKRSCLMDGPAVEAFTVSPRTGFLIPSDAENTLFLKNIENAGK